MVKIGSDPEFEVRTETGFFPCHNAYVAPAAVEESRGSYGTDGCSNTGELRPTEGTPAQHIKNISCLLQAVSTAISAKRQVFAGSGLQVPLGGHIHFSDTPTSSDFRAILDETITRPLNAISSPASVTLRRNAGYGASSSYRNNAWGWEYRAPLSWLSHPIIARGAIEIAYQLAILYRHLALSKGLDEADSYLSSIITDEKSLLNYLPAESCLIIEKYLDYKREILDKRIYLENIEVLQAWKIRKTRIIERYAEPPELPEPEYDTSTICHPFMYTPLIQQFVTWALATLNDQFFTDAYDVEEHHFTFDVSFHLSDTQETDICIRGADHRLPQYLYINLDRNRRNTGYDRERIVNDLYISRSRIDPMPEETCLSISFVNSSSPSITIKQSLFDRLTSVSQEEAATSLTYLLGRLIIEYFPPEPEEREETNYDEEDHHPIIVPEDILTKVNDVLAYRPKGETIVWHSRVLQEKRLV